MQVIAAGELLQKMARRKIYVTHIQEQGFEAILNQALAKTENAEAFSLLISVLKDYHMQPSRHVKEAAEQMLLDSVLEDSSAIERIREALESFK